jgi:hypothetical protein
MMRGFLPLLPLVALAAEPVSEIKIDERLPKLSGEFLTGRAAVLPQAAAGRVALLLLGFTYRSRFSVEPWAERFRAQFRSDPRVTFYEVPMIGGWGRLAKWWIDGGMRRGTPKEDYEHVITIYKDNGSWKQLVRFDDPDAAYLILLDRTGKVAWRYRGAFDDTAFQTLCTKASELVSAQ